MTEVRVQLMPNVEATKPKATSTKKIKVDFDSLVNYAISNIKSGKKKISKKKVRLFVKKYCYNAPAGTEITRETDLNKILNDGILISVSKGEDYIGYIEKVKESQLHKFDASPRYYIFKELENTYSRGVNRGAVNKNANNIDIINKHPSENITDDICKQEMNGIFPVLDGNLVPHLKKIVAENEGITQYYSEAGYYSYDYKNKIDYPSITNWESALLRECRGLIVSAVTGKILARRFHKFFNIGEIKETEFDNIDWTEAKIYDKIDGSLVSPIKLDSDQVVWATRKEIVTLDVDLVIAETDLIQYCFDNNMTPLFEWCQHNRTVGVISHNESSLTLLAIRHNITGEYIDIDTFSVNKPEPCLFEIEQLYSNVDGLVNKEGVVICLPNGHRYKYKSEWYRNIASSNYHGGTNRFMNEYLKRTNTIVDLPNKFIWKYLLNPVIDDKIKPLRQISDKTEFSKVLKFKQRIDKSLDYLENQLISWYNKINFKADNLSTVKKIININGWHDTLFINDATDKVIVDRTKLCNFLLNLVKQDNIGIVEEILDTVWSGKHHITLPLKTGFQTNACSLEIMEHVIDTYLPTKLSNMKGQKMTKNTKFAIHKGYKPNEGKLKGLWEQFSKKDVWDLRIDLQPHTKSIYTEHNGNEEYALLLVQYGLQDSNKVPKGSYAGILVPVDTEYTLTEYQNAMQYSFTNMQIVKMRRKFDTIDSFKIFCDLDGVLADFSYMVEQITKYKPEQQPKHKMWQRILSYNGFFTELPLMHQAKQFWKDIIKLNGGISPTILTGLPRSCRDSVAKDKRKWCHKHLSEETNVITCLSAQKHEYSAHKHILIDDTIELKDMWIKQGGIFIYHYNNETTLYELKKVLGKSLPKIKLDEIDETKIQPYILKDVVHLSGNLLSLEVIDDAENIKDEKPKVLIDNSKKAINLLDTQTYMTHHSAMFDGNINRLQKVGIDFEWNPYSTNKGVSICQISSGGHSYLIDMDTDSRIVQNCLLNPYILKIGFGLSDDVRRLGCNIINVVDIQDYIRDNYINVWNTPTPSLENIGKLICGINIEKDRKVQMSTWNQRPLSYKQIIYGAKDSSILVDIYDKLVSYNTTEGEGRKLVPKNLYYKETANKLFNFEYDLNKPIEVVYSGIMLTPKSVETLKSKFPGIYRHRSGDHITLQYKPTRHQVMKLNIGQYVDIEVIGYYYDKRLEVILVKTIFGEGHITISITEGIKAKESSHITSEQYSKLEKDKKFILNGDVGLMVTYIEDELAGLSGSAKHKILQFEKDAVAGESLKFKPEELTAAHRAIIHRYAEVHFMSTYSLGKDTKRRLILTMGRQKNKDSNLNIVSSDKKKKFHNITFVLKDSYLVGKSNIVFPAEKYIGEMVEHGIQWNKFLKQDKTLIILRGLSGSGKSTLVKSLDGIRVSADDYFMVEGIYKFDASQLNNAHKYCYQTTEMYLQNNYTSVIVDNTNSTLKEYNKYFNLAGKYKYIVIVLEIECIDKTMAIQFSKRNTHFNDIKVSINMFNRWEVDENALIVKPYFPDVKKESHSGNISLIKWLTDNKLITSIKSSNATHMWMSINNMGVKFISIPDHRRDEFYKVYLDSGITGDDKDEYKYLTEICQDKFRLYFDIDYEGEYIFEDIDKLVKIIKEISGAEEVYITGNHRESGDKMKTGLHVHCYDMIVDLESCLKIRTELVTKLVEDFPDTNWNHIVDESAYHVIRMLGSRKVTKEIDKANVYQVFYMSNDIDGVELMKKLSIHI